MVKNVLEFKGENYYYFSRKESNDIIQSTIFDGCGVLLGNSNELNYNLRVDGKKDYNRLANILAKVSERLGIVLWADFTNPANKQKIIGKLGDLSFEEMFLLYTNKYLNVGETDTLIIEKPLVLAEHMKGDAIFLGGAVADCAVICGNFRTEILSISHAGWQGIINGVIENLIDYYNNKLDRNDLYKVEFKFTPMAGINYEWERKFFDKTYLKEEMHKFSEKIRKIRKNISKGEDKYSYIKNMVDSLNLNGSGILSYFKNKLSLKYIKIKYGNLSEEILDDLKELNQIVSTYKKIIGFYKLMEIYDIDFLADKIITPNVQDPNKCFFFLDRLIKRIFLENGISEKQLYFHGDYTTDFNNKRPSYRIRTLAQKGLISPTINKFKNGDINDRRIGVFHGITIKK